jgi:hypothetical protein
VPNFLLPVNLNEDEFRDEESAVLADSYDAH